uniref:Cyclic nucleotide-binding domain-containing protein n=1 Tax=Eutreptiella gymnastica TaxID=73025 RepID=A0A7S1JCV8_9EUGL|mmetsp:Transcript_85168/g.149041  ORF Transcript_85168/g.149041 Transcript_85168/m.149041 type:complete len:423 (+) Transcript_85168:102-1370(+)
MGCKNSIHEIIPQESKPGNKYGQPEPDTSPEVTPREAPAADNHLQVKVYKPRPPSPGPNCTREELRAYLETYSMHPLDSLVDVDEKDVWDTQPTSPQTVMSHTSACAGVGRRKTVSDTSYCKEEESIYQMKNYPKSASEAYALAVALAKVTMFAHLDDRELDTIVASMCLATFPRDHIIFEMGQLPGEEDRMYVITTGQVELTSEHGQTTRFGPGDCFGGHEMLHMQTRQTTCRVVSEGLTGWSLERRDYRHLMRGAASRKRKAYGAVLKRIPFLKGLTRPELVQLADCLQPVQYQPGEYMIKYGEVGMWMYIVLDGTVQVMGRDQDNQPIAVCDFKPGDHVGELEFINKHLTVADVVAINTVRAARVHRDHFEICMGSIKDLLAGHAQSNQKYEYYRNRSPAPPSPLQSPAPAEPIPQTDP